jgi:2-methylcitrate dehydratase PrpD
MSVALTFADYTVKLMQNGAPAAAEHAAKRCLLDWYGGTLAGGVVPPAPMLAQALGGCAGPSRLLPGKQAFDSRTAALINGAASHSVEVDDIYRPGLYHPGSPVISAALAIGDAEGADGKTLLTAIIAGYEVSNRIAAGVNPAHYTYWHTTATVGHFGSAAAAAVMLGLDRDQTMHAICSVTTLAAGLRQAFASDAMSKPLHVGRAAETGVLGALAAKAGVTGVPDILEGVRGFGKAMSRDVDWGKIISDLDEVYTIESTTQKAHACCGHTFAAIDATQKIVADENLSPDQIRQIKVGTYQAGVDICGRPDPQTPYEAKFSLEYTCALAALRRPTAPQSFAEDVLGDAAIRSVMERIIVETDEDCEARFPRQRSAVVSITTTDGRTFTHHRPTRRGDPDDPLSDDEVNAKYMMLAEPVIGADKAAAISNLIWKTESLGNVRAIQDAL